MIPTPPPMLLALCCHYSEIKVIWRKDSGENRVNSGISTLPTQFAKPAVTANKSDYFFFNPARRNDLNNYQKKVVSVH